MSINIQLDTNAQAILSRIEAFQRTGMLKAIAAEMDHQNELTIAHIRASRLHGQGPFPPAEHKLGVRSSKLWDAVDRTPAEISGFTVSSGIADSIVYARVHEFGATIRKQARTGYVRLQALRDYSLKRNARGGAVFAHSEHKRTISRYAVWKQHDITMPARAPFYHGVMDRAADYGAGLSRAIVEEWNKS